MEETYSFGEWVSQRRHARHLTQRELATHAACALATIKKIEIDERRPSPELAVTLAAALGIPADKQRLFIECARGQRPVDALYGLRDDAPQRAASSLPAATTRLVGRDAELDEIARLLAQPECRLLTLVGTGGIGKTRLALETARRQGETFEDGAVFVPLAAVTDGALITSAIANSLQLGSASEAQLIAYLRQQELLIVADNCEQLGSGVAAFSGLLAQLPGVKLLATSRERLQLAEEWTFAVPELPSAEAFNLFDQAAQRAGVSLAGQDAAVNAVCAAVENMPLAIELAAGWLPVMSCAEIAAHIRRDVDFLAANVRNVPERHRSVRAVFDHSWQLLSERERDAFMRLSVFRGGWTADESQPVAGADVLLLRALIDKSLVRVGGSGRFDLHELTRQYAADKLRESGLEAETYDRYVDAFVALSERLILQLAGPDFPAALARTDAEMDNYRAVLAWAIEHDRTGAALLLLANTFFPWLRHGYWQEGERWHRAVLEKVEGVESRLVCEALVHVGSLIAVQGRYPEAAPYSVRGMEMARRLEDPEAMMTVAEQMMQAESDLDKARGWFDMFVSLLHPWDHPGRDARLSGAYMLFGDRVREQGQAEEAKSLMLTSLALARKCGSPMLSYPLGNLGRLALDAGRIDEAYDLISESVAISRHVGNRVGIADWVQRQGQVLLYKGDLVQAEACFEEALALYEEIGNAGALPEMMAFLAHTALLQDDVEKGSGYVVASLRGYKMLHEQVNEASAQMHGSRTQDDAVLIRRTPLDIALRCAGILAAEQGDDERAVVILGKVAQLTETDPRYPEPALVAKANDAAAAVRARLGDDAFARAWEAGRATALSHAIDLALGADSRSP